MIRTGRRGWPPTGRGGRPGGPRRRPPTWPACWTTRGALLIDGIGTWLAAVLDECGWDRGDGAARDEVAARIAELTGAWRQARGYVVAVSDEAGLGVVPASPPDGCSVTSSGG